MPYFPINGFGPDAPLDEQGVLMECDLLIPTLRGMKAFPASSESGISAVASNVASAISVELNNGTNRLIVGTRGDDTDTAKLYEVNVTNWTDVSSSAAGGNYTASTSALWTFAQYRDRIFASQKGHTLQSSSSGEFSAVAGGAPAARIVINVLDFVMCFDTTEATYGDSPDRWWNCAAGNPDSWTADIATQANTGLLTDSPGGIKAAKRLGSNVVAYKNRSMYLGQYVNTPLVWGWVLIPGEGLGTWSPYSVVDVEGVGHLFIGYDNIYVFDGTRATPIGTNRIAQYLFDNLNIEFAHLMVGFHYRQQSIVYWWFPSTLSTDGTLDQFLAYNYRSQRWGYGIKEVKFPFEYLEPGLTYDSLGTYYATYNDLPNASYNKAFTSVDTFKPAVFDWDNTIQRIDGPGESCSMRLSYFGADDAPTLVTRVRPRFHKAPTSGSMVHYVTDVLGQDGTTATASATYSNGRFDHVQEGRWHSIEMSFTGDTEILGVSVVTGPAGEE